MRGYFVVGVLACLLCCLGCGGGGAAGLGAGVFPDSRVNVDELVYHPPTGYTGEESLISWMQHDTGTQTEKLVYITETGYKYHRIGCRYLSQSKMPIVLSEAQEKGYLPCSVCDP